MRHLTLLKTLRQSELPLARATTALGVRRVVRVATDTPSVIEVHADGLLLTEVAPGIEPDFVEAQTEPELRRSRDLREMEL